MSEHWTEILLTVPTAGIDLVCNELAEIGCSGITVEERALDTFTPPDPDEMSEDEYPIRAYFPQVTDPEALRRLVTERLQGLRAMVPGLSAESLELRSLRGEDWAEGWKQHFGIERIGPRLVIKPTWEEFVPGEGDVVVTLDPGMAFGTGTHGTTRLCLGALAALFESDRPPRRVLDVGTGSGILSVAAAALGAERVLACDIETDACRIAAENARQNGLEEKVEVTGRPLDELEGEFDLVLANILAEENIRLADPLVARLAAAGALVLSGILREKEAEVVAAFSRFDLVGPEISYSDDWCCLLYRGRR